MMKKHFIIIVISISCFIITACNSFVSDPINDEVKTLTVSGKFELVKDFNEVYEYADYLVICKVVSKGESYLKSGKLNTDLPEKEIMNKLIGMRTPYEIKILEFYKGDLKVDESYTVLTLEGHIGDYAVDAGLPDLEVGKTYLMPICISDPTESFAYFPALSEVIGYKEKLFSTKTSSLKIVPLMFEKAYEEIDDIADVKSAVESITASFK